MDYIVFDDYLIPKFEAGETGDWSPRKKCIDMTKVKCQYDITRTATYILFIK